MNYAESIRKHGKAWIGGLAIFVLALGLRWIQLDAIPEAIFDEIHYVPAAKVLAGLEPHPGMGVWSFHHLIGKAPAPNFEHPLLGKFLIGFGMKLLGNDAFGWRLFPALAGSLSLLLMAWLGLRFFKKPGLAIAALFFLSFDPMHILHSRIAMLDIFLVSALIAVLLASHALIESPMNWNRRVVAAFCLAAGFSIKWVFAFAILGFCWCLLFLGAARWQDRLKTLVWVGVMALGFYHLWFFYYQAHGFSYSEWLEFHLAANSVTTGKLTPHPYGASALSMLFNSRNIWYYFKQVPELGTLGLVCLMNPLLIFSTLPALAIVLWNYYRHRERSDAFILGWFVCCYAPFHLVLLQRQGFLYYMLLIQPIIILAVTRALALLLRRTTKPWGWMIYATVFGFLSLFFLPVTLALPMPSELYLLVIRWTGV